MGFSPWLKQRRRIAARYDQLAVRLFVLIKLESMMILLA